MLYRFLLWLCFPRRTRREYGDEMTRLFADQMQQARFSGASTAAVWLEAVADAVIHGIPERLAPARRAVVTLVGHARRWRWWMHALVRDAAYAVRMLRRQPGVTLLAILTMALGIGANTAIFSAVDAVLLRPLPYDDPDGIVMVWEKRPVEGVLDNVVAPADFVDWARMNSSFEAMAAQDVLSADLTGYGDPVRLLAGAVSPGFFEIFRVRPLLGRTFSAEEGMAGKHRVVMLGHRLWQARFGSDRGVVGRKILLNGVPFEVVGVLPASFEFPDSSIDLWGPIPYEGRTEPLSRALHQIDVYARLKPGVSIEQARADMDRVAAVLSQQYPETNENHGAHVVSLQEQLAEPIEGGLLLLFGAVGFVLLIACVNVANLLLAKAAARRREMAIRAAVGAGRGRLAGQALTESVVLGLSGGAAGLLVAYWGIALVRGLAPEGLRVIGLERLGLDARVLAFTFVLSLVTSVLFGMLPAWQAARQDVNDSLKDGGRTGTAVRRRLRVGLVVSEIALASLLLVGAGLSLRSFAALLHAEPGIELENRLTAFVSLPPSRYRGEARQAAYEEIDRRFASIAGVRATGAVNHLPLSGTNSRLSISIEGREPVDDAPMRAHPRSITPGYFTAIGMTVKAGRGFSARDRAGAPLVAVVNEAMARAYWPGESPIGQRLRLGGTEEWREVIGIVADVRHNGLDRPAAPELYLPLAQYVWNQLTFVLATEGHPSAFAAAARDQLRAIDPDLPLSRVRTMEEVAARSVASRRSGMILLATFGLLALVLSAAGIYGVTAHLVALRTAEIGVRMTLGARPGDVMRLVVREGTIQACIGLAVGLSGAMALTRPFRAMLFGVGPADPLTLAGVAAILLTTTILACLVPARRAMRVDPVQALRM